MSRDLENRCSGSSSIESDYILSEESSDEYILSQDSQSETNSETNSELALTIDVNTENLSTCGVLENSLDNLKLDECIICLEKTGLTKNFICDCVFYYHPECYGQWVYQSEKYKCIVCKSDIYFMSDVRYKENIIAEMSYIEDYRFGSSPVALENDTITVAPPPLPPNNPVENQNWCDDIISRNINVIISILGVISVGSCFAIILTQL